MIITIGSHGRRRRDTAALLSHLAKQHGQRSRVVAIGNAPVRDAAVALRFMEVMRDGSRATIAFHHLTINPTRSLTENELDELLDRILAALGAKGHAYVVWKHSEKPRATADGAVEHYHLVVCHIGPDGRALDHWRTHSRLESVARSFEFDLGESLTPSRRTPAVANELRKRGRDDVADAMMAAAPVDLPRSATSSRRRAAAARAGVDLPVAQEAVRKAFRASDSPNAFRAALSELGFEVIESRTPGVYIVLQNGVMIGALDRIVREVRMDIAVRMTGLSRAILEVPFPTERQVQKSATDDRPTSMGHFSPAPLVVVAKQTSSDVDRVEPAPTFRGRRFDPKKLDVAEARAQQQLDDATAPPPDPSSLLDARRVLAKRRRASTGLWHELNAAQRCSDELVSREPKGIVARLNGSYHKWLGAMATADREFAERQSEHGRAAQATREAEARVEGEEQTAARAVAADEPRRRAAAAKAKHELALIAWAREHHSRVTARPCGPDARTGMAEGRFTPASLVEEPDDTDQDVERNSRTMRP